MTSTIEVIRLRDYPIVDAPRSCWPVKPMVRSDDAVLCFYLSLLDRTPRGYAFLIDCVVLLVAGFSNGTNLFLRVCN
jgi:hypothetical protein